MQWYLFAERPGEDNELFRCHDRSVLDAYRQMYDSNGWTTVLDDENGIRRHPRAAEDFDANLISTITGLPATR